MPEGERAYWRRLDNAAKIFPATSSRRDTRVFRFYCELKEDVEEKILSQALDMTLEVYPIFLSVMRKGLFWFYLEKSDIRPVVREEKDPPCLNLYIRDRRSLLFQVNYYKKRINFEVYHALTDGTGASMFLKELVKNYLYLKHAREGLANTALTPEDTTVQDMETDSFSKYYTRYKNIKTNLFKKKPCRITGSRVSYGSLNVTEGTVSCQAVRQKAKEFGVSVTAFLSAVFMCSIHEEVRKSQRHKEIILMVPVNLRQFFSSNSLLNFFGWMDPNYVFKEEAYDFKEVVETVNHYFKQELTTENVGRHMSTFMKLERNPLLRIAPLEIKTPVMQFSNFIAQNDVTAILSNLGVVRMPQEYEQYIQRFGVFISTSKVQLSVCSFQNELVLSFASAFQEKNIERNFFRILKGFGIETEVLHNQFPEQKKTVDKGSLFTKWLSFGCLALAVISVMINIMITPGMRWSLYCLAGAGSLWIVCLLGYFKRYNMLKNSIWQLLLVSGLGVLWDRYTGWQGWSLDFLVPILCLMTVIFQQIVAVIKKMPWKEYMIYFFMTQLFGLLPGVFIVLGMVKIMPPSVLCAGVNILLLAAMLIFKGKEMAAELHKKLHF